MLGKGSKGSKLRVVSLSSGDLMSSMMIIANNTMLLST